MRIHQLNRISTCPLGGKLMDGRTDPIVQRGEPTCHGLLVELDNTLCAFAGHSARLPINKMTRPYSAL